MHDVTPLSKRRSQGSINFHEVESGRVVQVKGSSTANLLSAIRQRSRSGRTFFTQYREIEDGVIEVRCYEMQCPLAEAADYYDDYEGADSPFQHRIPAWRHQLAERGRRNAKNGTQPNSKYPWDEWQNGEVHEVDPAEYGLDPFMLGVRLRSRVGTLNKRYDKYYSNPFWVQIEDFKADGGRTHTRFVFMRASDVTEDHPARDQFTWWTLPAEKPNVERVVQDVEPWRGAGGVGGMKEGDDPDAIDAQVKTARTWREDNDVVIVKLTLTFAREFVDALHGYSWRYEFWRPYGRCIRIKNYFA